MISRTADSLLASERDAVAEFCRTHSGVRFRAARDYVRSNQSVFVAVPGRGMVNLMDFGPADEAAFAGYPLDDLIQYSQEFRGRVNAQSRRLRGLGVMTSKTTVAVPGGQFLRRMTELSEDDLRQIEATSDTVLQQEFERQTGRRRPQPVAVQPARATAPASRRDRPLALYTPPVDPHRRHKGTTLA